MFNRLTPRLPHSVAKLPIKFLRSFQSNSSNLEAIFGPREIYDSALINDKVLSVSYEDILRLPKLLHLIKPDTSSLSTAQLAETNTQLKVSCDDLFVISKIMRRAPRLHDQSLIETRQTIARQLCYAAAMKGSQAASLFWCEESLRTSRGSSADRTEAMSILSDLAKSKNGKANYLIANELYSLKQLTPAMKAYRLAGEQGISEAYTKLGRILRSQGHHRQSVSAFKMAADAGEPNAQFMMSTFTKDEGERIKYLQLAASGGKEEAAHNLGEHYRRTGQQGLAKEYLALAAAKGLQVSQMNLASILREEKAFGEAEKWYHQAVKSGGEIAEHAKSSLEDMQSSPEYKARNSGSCTMM